MICRQLRNRSKGLLRRAATLVLAAALLCGIPPLWTTAEAAAWMEPYLDKLVEWGVMYGDASGNLHPDRQVTRAEMVTMMNRAFGYKEPGPNPFVDVPDNAWYAEDIRIAYQAGYFYGSSGNTAAPNAPVTREQAAALLGRSLRLQGSPGASTQFADNQEIGAWSRGLVQEAADLGIILGYEDGTFRPRQLITRGQMAVFLVRALGTLINRPGEQVAGGVYGNLTVNTTGVKLKDTVVTGNLYLSGGVGLGSVELENVRVMGKIVVCGAGEAEKGENSVILRNVTANGLEIDSLKDQFVSLRAEGLTDIAATTVRTSSYIEDVTGDGLGLKLIDLDGAEGLRVDLAGNIKEVVNRTPDSTLLVAQGVADTVTVDEKAAGSALSIDTSASIRKLNLDAGTPVTGGGSIASLAINAAGSTVSMLPDTITVRPGLTGNIYSQNMDTTQAAESSDTPRLLSGYPYARNVASTTAEAMFSTNKQGTVYWAVSALMDGSLSDLELMNPSAYPGKVLKSGTISAAASKTEYAAKLTGLTKEGSYYISAMLVDNRNHRSPVKVAAFTTTDDSVPAFSTGYPAAPILTTKSDDGKYQIVQDMVMATKSCQLYYALLPNGSSAPSTNALKSGAVTGNLGYGMVNLTRETPYLIPEINSSYLDELTTYRLYLWLNDADSGKSSAVKALTVTTLDRTEPVVTNLYQSEGKDTSVKVTYSINEPATLFWVLVETGKTPLRPAVSGDVLSMEDLEAKVQVEAGGGNANVIRSGSANAAKGDTNYVISITGLQPQAHYDLYYVAKDKAGNYSARVEVKRDILTNDNVGPRVELRYTAKNTNADGVEFPLVTSDITLRFNEYVRGFDMMGQRYDDFEKLYQAVEDAIQPGEKAAAKETLAQALRKYITLYPGTPPRDPGDILQQDPVTDIGLPENAELEPEELVSWIDYREAQVERRDGMQITFPGGTGIRLQSGGEYFFRLNDVRARCHIQDASSRYIDDKDEQIRDLPFSVAFATIRIENINSISEIALDDGTGTQVLKRARVFSLEPRETNAVPDSTRWDMLLWTDATFEYDLYVRKAGDTGWDVEPLGHFSPSVITGEVYDSLWYTCRNAMNDWYGNLFGDFNPRQGLPYLTALDTTAKLEFAIVPVESTINQTIHMKVTLMAGENLPMQEIALPGSEETLAGKNVTPIGRDNPHKIPDIGQPTVAPSIIIGHDAIVPYPTSVTINAELSNYGRLYCMAIPLRKDADGNNPEEGITYTLVDASANQNPERDGMRPDLSIIPTSSMNPDGTPDDQLVLDKGRPDTGAIQRGNPNNRQYAYRFANTGNEFLEGEPKGRIEIGGLQPETTYLLYLVSAMVPGPNSAVLAEQAICYRFTTLPAVAPNITVPSKTTTSAVIQASIPAKLFYILLPDDLIGDTTIGFGAEFKTGSPLVENPLPSGYTGTTVWQAMYQDHPSGGSVFQHCATSEAKREYCRRILDVNTFAQYARKYDSLSQSKGNLISVDTEDGPVRSGSIDLAIQETNDHSLLIVGTIVDPDDDPTIIDPQRVDPSLLAFKVDRPFANTKRILPTVSTCGPGENQSFTPDVTFTGTLNVEFTNNSLYISLRKAGQLQKGYPLDNCGRAATQHAQDDDGLSSDGYLNIGKYISMNPSYNVTLKGTVTHGQNIGGSLQFSVTNAPADPNETNPIVSFDGRLCVDSNGHSREETDRLYVYLKKRVETGADGTPVTIWYATYSENWAAQ